MPSEASAEKAEHAIADNLRNFPRVDPLKVKEHSLKHYLQSPDVGQLPWSPKCASNESSQSVDDPFSDSLLLPLDVLAMRASFDAFLANREDERLEGFEAYTAEQMFFIASCYMSCQGSDLSWAMTSKHQCDAPLQNLNEFAMAFSCDPGSPMNPVEKCSIV
ncbi:hypothetical protein HPB48_010992 [Haemaphysalis longicornis]|uniref:Peptidase M13 C-terminal domain-containing protein n=1 Tax=Haemaphysalis longicornis TaxID=44386 RepID=A0A9J6FLR2_HAELO|nr:hypothetical protein HPB48_010992 [Haemaphysalis longicornis]